MALLMKKAFMSAAKLYLANFVFGDCSCRIYDNVQAKLRLKHNTLLLQSHADEVILLILAKDLINCRMKLNK